jgi:hypothetical protein
MGRWPSPRSRNTRRTPNRRIPPAAIRRADAFEAHLDGRAIPAPLLASASARFTVSRRQSLINHRIALAALRRVDRLVARADGRPAPRPRRWARRSP